MFAFYIVTITFWYHVRLSKNQTKKLILCLGNIFVIGGTDEAGCRLSSGEYFSPGLVKWRKIASLKRPRSGSALVSCKGNTV